MTAPVVVSLAVAADMLDCTRKQVSRLGKQGRIRLVRLGWRTIRVHREDVERIIAGLPPLFSPRPSTVATTTEVQSPRKAIPRRRRTNGGARANVPDCARETPEPPKATGCDIGSAP